MALNKVKIKNTESIRLVTGDKTEISGGSSFSGIDTVGVTNGIADAGVIGNPVSNKTSLTIHSRVPGISFSVATSGITAEIEAFPVTDSEQEEIFSRIAGNNHLYFFTTVSGPTNIPTASAAGEFIFNADRREISIHALDLNNRSAGKQSFASAAEIFNGVILASRTDTAGENVFEEHTITYNNPTFDGTKFDVDDVTITNGATLESWYGGTRPVLVSIIPDPALLGATEVAARTAFVFPDGCSAQSIVSSWNGMTCEVTFDQYVADINGITGPIDTSGLTFNFAGVSASGDITTNKLIFGDGTEMSTASSGSGSGGVTSINDVVASFNGLTGAVTLSAGTGITLTGSELSVDAVTSFNGSSGDVTYLISAGTGITLTGTELNVDAVTSFNGSSGDVTLTAGTGITLTGSELNVDAVTSINGISGAIDTSGLTFDFAGISASGDITAGGRLVADVVQSEDNVNSRYGFDINDTIFSVYTGNNDRRARIDSSGIHAENGRIKANTFVEAETYVHAGTGVSLDAFGITFPDGTYQDTASSGSGGVTSINDVVASLNGLTGAIDTSGLTFNFAGLSASGDLTVGGAGTFGDSIVIPNGQYIYNNQSSSIRPSVRLATSEVVIDSKSSGTPGRLSVSNSQVKVSNVPFVSEQLINAQAGISMDTAGITFSDGLAQIQASHSFVGAGFDGQGATLQANTVLVPVEQAGSIRSATIVGDVSGSLSVSIFKYGVTSDTADLGASAEVGTISLLEKIIIRDTTEITGTTADIAEGDILAFSLGATAAGAPIIASQKATCKLKIHDK